MEELIGPQVEIVLNIKEVTDLGFINTPVVIVATVVDNKMETDVLDVIDGNIRFNVDLVWETNKTNIKKMRNSNVSIKINLFKYFNENRREKFGYVVMSLRTAQYAPRGKTVKINDTSIKILGLGKEAKGFSPHLLLSLRVQDKITDKVGDSLIMNALGNEISSSMNHENIMSKPEKGDEEDSSVLEENNIKYEGGDGPPSPPRTPRAWHSLTANLNEMRTSLTSYEKKNSSGDLQPGLSKKYIQAFHSFKLKIFLRNIVFYKVPPKFNFRFHHSRSEVTFAAHPEITIEYANEEVDLCDIETTFAFIETPSEFFKLLSSIPPNVSMYCNVQNRATIIGRGVLECNNIICNGDETLYNIEFFDIKTRLALGKLTYSASLTDCGPQIMKDVTLKLKQATAVEESDVPPVFVDTMTDKIVDELEEWKERQKDIFQQKFAAKLKTEIQELQAEWMDRKRDLEEQLNDKMEQCRELGTSLITATEDVKQKNREILEKERALETTRNELEMRYLKLLTEKNDETEKLRIELELTTRGRDERIHQLEQERKDLIDRLKDVQTENDRMKEALKTSEIELEKNKRACLSQEQTATLLQDLKAMQEKLDTANNSKLFFKEQWGRAVREIHRIKSEYTKNIQVQLQYRKDELKKLGLEQLCNDKNRSKLDNDDLLDGKDFLGSDFDVRSNISDLDFPYKSKPSYESFKSSMDLVRESNTYLLKNNQEHEERLNKLIEERDKLLCDGLCQIDDERVIKLNKEIRHLLEQ
ncbi:hypothetical protein RUM44_005943 [Polyplax serrata]|uniref:DUF3668 domain-containing protein n=1 Tax=Polyplax serrata TaxID=468196 RepID=A0ABR1AYI2_POLSC